LNPGSCFDIKTILSNNPGKTIITGLPWLLLTQLSLNRLVIFNSAASFAYFLAHCLQKENFPSQAETQ
jgi:hypothetical protein